MYRSCCFVVYHEFWDLFWNTMSPVVVCLRCQIISIFFSIIICSSSNNNSSYQLFVILSSMRQQQQPSAPISNLSINSVRGVSWNLKPKRRRVLYLHPSLLHESARQPLFHPTRQTAVDKGDIWLIHHYLSINQSIYLFINLSIIDLHIHAYVYTPVRLTDSGVPQSRRIVWERRCSRLTDFHSHKAKT